MGVVAATTASGPPIDGDTTDVPPDRAVEIYRWAAEDATCPLDWTVLAGLAAVGSDHGRVGGATVDHRGDVRPPIAGPALDGLEGRRLILDTDAGRLDGDAELDRAVGPFQFLPTTWASVGIDGNGDGDADPHNFWDAAASAAALLCHDDALPTPTLTWYASAAFDGLVEDATVAATASTVQRVRGEPQELGVLVLNEGLPADETEGPERVVPLDAVPEHDHAGDDGHAAPGENTNTPPGGNIDMDA